MVYILTFYFLSLNPSSKSTFTVTSVKKNTTEPLKTKEEGKVDKPRFNVTYVNTNNNQQPKDGQFGPFVFDRGSSLFNMANRDQDELADKRLKKSLE